MVSGDLFQFRQVFPGAGFIEEIYFTRLFVQIRKGVESDHFAAMIAELFQGLIVLLPDLPRLSIQIHLSQGSTVLFDNGGHLLFEGRQVAKIDVIDLLFRIQCYIDDLGNIFCLSQS